jgi:hypothetical protein
MFILEMFEGAGRRVVVTYPGRFQPFHLGHADVFKSLQSRFGSDNVFVVTGNKTDNEKSPFNFSDKVQFMHAAGIPDHSIIEASKPYDLPDQFKANAEDIIFIAAVGAPDAQRLNPGSTKKDGSSSYFQKLPDDLSQAATADQHGYVIIADEREKTITIDGQAVDVSHGTPTRALWNQIRDDENKRASFLKQMYGKANPALGEIMDKIGGMSETATEPGIMQNMMNKINPVKKWLLDLKDKLGTEADETKDMFDTYVRYTQGQASEQEMNAANEQFKDLLRGLGMGTLAAMPGSVITLPVVFKLAKKFNVEIMPSSFRSPTDPMAEGLGDIAKQVATWFLKKDGDVIRTLSGTPRTFKSKEEAIEWAMKTYKVSYNPKQIVATTNPDKNLMTPTGATVAETYDHNFHAKPFTKRRADVTGEDEPRGIFTVVINGRDWKTATSNEAFRMASAVKRKHPEKKVGVRWPNGQMNMLSEEAAAVGVVRDGNDPRYIMSTMGDQNDVTGDTLNQMMRSYNLIGKKSTGKLKPVKGNIGKGKVDEATSAAVRMQRAFQRAQEQGRRERSAGEELYRRHQEIRKQSGLPDPEYYKELGRKKQQEIDALRAEIEADQKRLGKDIAEEIQALRRELSMLHENADPQHLRELQERVYALIQIQEGWKSKLAALSLAGAAALSPAPAQADAWDKIMEPVRKVQQVKRDIGNAQRQIGHDVSDVRNRVGRDLEQIPIFGIDKIGKTVRGSTDHQELKRDPAWDAKVQAAKEKRERDQAERAARMQSDRERYEQPRDRYEQPRDRYDEPRSVDREKFDDMNEQKRNKYRVTQESATGGATGAGAIAAAPTAGAGSLFGGSYEQSRNPFRKKGKIKK